MAEAIGPLAASGEAWRAVVAAPQVRRYNGKHGAGNGILALLVIVTVLGTYGLAVGGVAGSGAMRCIRCLRRGGLLPVVCVGAVIVPVSTDWRRGFGSPTGAMR